MSSGLVDPAKFRPLVADIPDSAYSRYPNLSRAGVDRAVADFPAAIGGGGPRDPARPSR